MYQNCTSVQAEQQFPPTDVSGVFRDAAVLVLTLTRFENGKPIWTVIALTLEGDKMQFSQTLELSHTIKRGTSTKQ